MQGVRGSLPKSLRFSPWALLRPAVSSHVIPSVGQVSCTAFQFGPALGFTTPPPPMAVPFHVPERGLARAHVLEQDVRGSFAAGSDRLPARPWIGAEGPAADQVRPVHLP